MHKNIKKIFTLILTILILTNSFVFAEELILTHDVSSYLVGDYTTGRILEQQNIDEPIEIASITKLMSYIVIAEEIKNGNISLEDNVYIDYDTAQVGGSSLKLKEGENLKVSDLLKGLMIVSGNDATYALAKHTYGTEENFVNEMKKKANDLGLDSAELHNCTGLPVPNPDGSYENRKQNKMSTRDIFAMSQYLIKEYPEVLELSSQTQLIMPEREFEQNNTNDLLTTMPGVDGFKTGFTDKAGYCLVSTFKNDLKEYNNRLIAVVMGAANVEQRSFTTREILEFSLNKYRSKDLLNSNKPVEVFETDSVMGGYIKVYPKNNYSEIIKKEDNIDMSIELNKKLKPSIKKGEIVGNAKIYKNDEVIDEVELIVKDELKRNNFITRFIEKIKSIIKGIFG